MNRVIKFRGKRIDDGRWVFGQYVQCPLTVENFGNGHITTPDLQKNHCISVDGTLYQVDPNTIGQCTDCMDSRGHVIYEGDRINYKLYSQKGTVNFYAGQFMCDFDDETDLTLGFMLTDHIEIIGDSFKPAVSVKNQLT
jgi:uncharacterized phage protein (TIGR01671 family)